MKVEVVDAVKIRPSSPTPPSRKSYKLSLVDQLSYNVKVPVLLFYGGERGGDAVVNGLRESLSRTLSHFYPLAGSLNPDRLTVECNDDGVDFIEAVVDGDLDGVLRDPTVEILRQLLPCNPLTGSYEPSPDGRVLVVQVNRFSCGGVGIGIIVSHAIADASVAAAFFNAWASVNRGGLQDIFQAPIFGDTSAIFPPITAPPDPTYEAEVARAMAGDPEAHYAVKRFVFPASAIAHLRDQMDPGSRRPTRVETLTSFVWAAVIRGTHERHGGRIKTHVVASIVNFRSRMVPPLPPNCMGSNTIGTAARWPSSSSEEETKNPRWQSLVGRVRESIGAVNDSHVRKQYNQEVYLSGREAAIEMLKKRREERESYCLHAISWCRIPFWEADFGWGRPRWAAYPHLLKDAAVFIDGEYGGEGVDVWLGLPLEVMHTVEQELLGFLETFNCKT